jgi:hypothetical protein
MTRLPLLVWLIAMLALIAPPGLSLSAMAAPVEKAATVDCPDHTPPPSPCPDKGTAKHAAGTCCPLMAGAVALLSPAMVIEATFALATMVAPSVRSLSGRTFTKDPPPPRV